MKLKFMTGLQIAFFSVLIIATAQSVLADGSSSSGNAANKAKFQAALQTCASSENITLPTTREGWKSLTQEQRQSLHSCMKAAGFKMHRHHHWKAIQACVAKAGVALPQFTPGQRPTLTDEQKAAIQTCKKQLKAAHEAAKSNPTN